MSMERHYTMLKWTNLGKKGIILHTELFISRYLVNEKAFSISNEFCCLILILLKIATMQYMKGLYEVSKRLLRPT